MSAPRLTLVLVVLAAGLLVGSSGHVPSPAWAATCADYPNQAAAQAAGDTRDADGDGVYCESLPCPCSTAPPVPTPAPGPPPVPTPTPQASPADCTSRAGVQDVSFSKAKYPNIRRHFLRALRRGWPRTLVLNRDGASARRARLLEGVATKRGYDRDEYPPALARGKGKGLVKGVDPRGWRADVMLVPSHENRSHGSVMGLKLRRFCNGTKFRYVFA